jgi:O-antigen ligase
MSTTAVSVVPTARRAGAPLVALAAAAVAVGFFCTQHTPLIARMESYGTTQEDLEANAAGGKLKNQVGFSLIALLGVVLLACPGGRAWQVRGVLPLAVLLFLAWCLASTLWSPDPGRTVKKTAILAMCLIGTLGIAKHLSARDLCVVALTVSASYAVVGVAAELSLGTLTPFAAEYRFAGTQHPNGQGACCGLLFLSAFFLLGADTRNKPLLLVLLVLGASLLLLTKSRTPLVGVAVALVAVRCLRPSPGFVGTVFGVAWLGFGLLLWTVLDGGEAGRYADVLLLGRAEHAGTLTGRTELWAELLPYALERPLLGHGYGSFWNADRIDTFATTLYWSLSSAHSVYLETFLSVGLIGAGLLAVVGVGGLWRAAWAYRRIGGPGHALVFALFIYGAAEGVAESDFIGPSFVAFVTGCGLAQLAFFRPEEAPSGTPATGEGMVQA